MSDEIGLTRVKSDCYQVLFLFRIPNLRRSTVMADRFVKNETVSKVWLTEITGPTPDCIPNMLVGRNRPKFQESLHWLMASIRGLRVSMRCSIASQVMASFLSFFTNDSGMVLSREHRKYS